MKFQRQSKILEIINKNEVETQEELMEKLIACGHPVTQATISRDIKELRLVKALSRTGKYMYAVSAEQSDMTFSTRLRGIFRESVTSYDRAQNIIVIKTLPGLAPAACSALDATANPSIVGTLAGDDTAFIAMRDNAAAENFMEQIMEMLS